jgi:predicted nuclease of predicted toxin-antitoxin system
MKFFLDNNLSENLAQGLKIFGEDVIHLKDMFNEDTEDQIWLEQIGQKKMYLITRDERIRRNPFELNALKTYKVGAFFLGGKNLGRCKIIQQVVRNWPRIKELSARKKPPFAFRIPPQGTKFSQIDL